MKYYWFDVDERDWERGVDLAISVHKITFDTEGNNWRYIYINFSTFEHNNYSPLSRLPRLMQVHRQW